MTSNKPTYAAIAAVDPGSPKGQSTKVPVPLGDAPPPYSGPSLTQAPSHGPNAPNAPASHEVGDTNRWIPPANLAVARSRAQRRFWVAFFWAWAIWIVVGLIVGGGVRDIEQNPVGRPGHWGKHGRWHDDVGLEPGRIRVGEENDSWFSDQE